MQRSWPRDQVESHSSCFPYTVLCPELRTFPRNEGGGGEPNLCFHNSSWVLGGGQCAGETKFDSSYFCLPRKWPALVQPILHLAKFLFSYTPNKYSICFGDSSSPNLTDLFRACRLLRQESPLPSDFWLGSAPGKHLQELGGQGGREGSGYIFGACNLKQQLF